MSGIWVYSDEISLTKQLLTPAAALASQLNCPIAACTPDKDAAEQLTARGADEVYILTGAERPENYTALLYDLIKNNEPDVFLVGGTLRGKETAARIAALLSCGLVTDALSVAWEDNRLVTTRMMYGGLAVCTESLAPLAMATIPPNLFDEPPVNPDRQAKVQTVSVSCPPKITVVESTAAPKGQTDLPSADKVVCVGRGVKRCEDMELVNRLAEALNAQIGCTRSIAEDYHWLPAENYIGLSGQKIKPSLYLSLGVSGQIQHVSGIRDSKIIAAIDLNENAPIFAAADYGIVGDLYEAVPALIEALANRRKE